MIYSRRAGLRPCTVAPAGAGLCLRRESRGGLHGARESQRTERRKIFFSARCRALDGTLKRRYALSELRGGADKHAPALISPIVPPFQEPVKGEGWEKIFSVVGVGGGIHWKREHKK